MPTPPPPMASTQQTGGHSFRAGFHSELSLPLGSILITNFEFGICSLAVLCNKSHGTAELALIFAGAIDEIARRNIRGLRPNHIDTRGSIALLFCQSSLKGKNQNSEANDEFTDLPAHPSVPHGGPKYQTRPLGIVL